MVIHRDEIPHPVLEKLRQGTVIPAHPLALDRARKLDKERQRALSRYYIDAGAGALAVGVHTTQFAIRDHGLYEPVLRLAAETAAEWSAQPIGLIAGVTGGTHQAIHEAQIARALGYHAVLLNVAAFSGAAEDEILGHCKRVSEEIPIVGFSLLPECGGFHLSYAFWRAFAGIENVIAIKMAPFNRYRTVEIVRAVQDAGAAERVTLYTGNDDHIVADLLTPFPVGETVADPPIRIRGGLLGHWSVWTKQAVELLARIHALKDGAPIPSDLLALDPIVTDCNNAIYDAQHDFAACVPGCLEVLRRQGLVGGTYCLDHKEVLALGQIEEIDRVYANYPWMNDDAFVAANLHRWLSGSGQSSAVA